MRKEMRDELMVQLILMGVSLAVSALLYWLILMPQWKRQAMIIKTVKVLDDGKSKARDLTGREMLMVREFAAQVSQWDHEQLALFRKKRGSNASQGNVGMGPCDNRKESD